MNRDPALTGFGADALGLQGFSLKNRIQNRANCFPSMTSKSRSRICLSIGID
jgi:hypothetical protein